MPPQPQQRMAAPAMVASAAGPMWLARLRSGAGLGAAGMASPYMAIHRLSIQRLRRHSQAPCGSSQGLQQDGGRAFVSWEVRLAPLLTAAWAGRRQGGS